MRAPKVPLAVSSEVCSRKQEGGALGGWARLASALSSLWKDRLSSLEAPDKGEKRSCPERAHHDENDECVEKRVIEAYVHYPLNS